MSDLTRERVTEIAANGIAAEYNADWLVRQERQDLATALLATWDAVDAAQEYINEVLGCPSPDFLATVAAREAMEDE